MWPHSLVGVGVVTSVFFVVGESQFRALPRTAHVLNPSRGPSLDETALFTALCEGWIAGAAIDTYFFNYPLPAEHRLWGFPNVILTPHVSGTDKNQRFPRRMQELLAHHLERWVAGKPMLYEVSAAEWLEAWGVGRAQVSLVIFAFCPGTTLRSGR